MPAPAEPLLDEPGASGASGASLRLAALREAARAAVEDGRTRDFVPVEVDEPPTVVVADDGDDLPVVEGLRESDAVGNWGFEDRDTGDVEAPGTAARGTAATEERAGSPSRNGYTRQLLAHREALAAARVADERAAQRAAAREASFASLTPAAAATAAGIAHLAGVAGRRMARWRDPRTGGLDPADRAELMRQAAVMNLPAADATRAIDGAERAFLAAPPPASSRQKGRPRPGGRGRPSRALMWTLTLLAAAATQAALAALWLAR